MIDKLADEENSDIGNQTIVVGDNRPTRPRMPKGAPSSGGSTDNLPTLHLISPASVSKYPIQNNVYVVSVGNSRDAADIFVQDSELSGKQLIVIKIGGEWMFLDCGGKDVVEFNGAVSYTHLTLPTKA